MRSAERGREHADMREHGAVLPRSERSQFLAGLSVR